VKLQRGAVGGVLYQCADPHSEPDPRPSAGPLPSRPAGPQYFQLNVALTLRGAA
jgi:hypothetical protein